MKDFFISYNKADRSWAEWIAWQLEEAGYTTVIQAWDFRPGSNFVLEMQKAAAEAERTITVLSPNYLTALYTQPEWAAAFAQDPTGEEGTLLSVRVRECDLKGLLSQIVYIDIMDLDEETAQKLLLDGVRRERAKPTAPPSFPGTAQRSVTKQPRFPGGLPPIWNVPHNRNPNFTGRESLLIDLRTALTSGQPAALIQAIYGLGGVGKTQLAVEYAYRYAAEYDVVWWVRAEEPVALAADYASLAQALGLPQKDISDQQVVTEAVRRWLGQNARWLLIFDNAGDPKEIHDYIPQGTTGHVLITSRNPNWREIANPLRIDVFKREESVDYLRKRTGQADETEADKLAEELGDLPLALAQAGAYIETTGITLAKYLELLRFHRKELWSEEHLPLDYHHTVATTWSLAMDRVRDELPISADLLNLCAYLAPDNIPYKLLSQGKEHLPESLSTLVTDSLSMNKAIAILRQYSLIEVTDDMLSVHRLVQSIVRDRLEEDTRRIWTRAALYSTGVAFHSYEKDVQTWSKCSRLLPHVLVAAKHAEELEVACEDVGDLLNLIGGHLIDRAQFEEAETILSRALTIRERVHGQEHTDVAHSLNDLGTLYRNQGKYAEADSLYKRAREIYKKAHGPDHPHIATTLGNMGLVYKTQGKYNEAELLYKQALQIFESNYGPEDIHVAVTINNIALLCKEQSKYDEAETLCKKALQICEKKLASNHPTLAACIHSLALIYRDQGKYNKAEPLLRSALQIWEKVLDPDHPNVATGLNNLAALCIDQGKYDEAELHLKMTLEIRERILRPNHPDIVVVLKNILKLYEKTGRMDEAEKLKERIKKFI